MDRDIQPRTVPEILDAGLNLYRRHFWLLLAFSFATTLPLPASAFRTPDPQNPLAGLRPMLLSGLINLILSVIKGWLVTAALTEEMLGRRATLKTTLDRLLPVVPALILRMTWFGILMTLGTCLLLVPGVLLYLAWLFYSQVVIVEGRGVAAFGRSAELTRGERGRIGILVTVLGLLEWSLSLGFSVTSHLMRWGPAEPVMTYLSMLLIGPLQPAVLLVAYFDLRSRREGLDLGLRSKALDSAAAGPATAAGVA